MFLFFSIQYPDQFSVHQELIGGFICSHRLLLRYHVGHWFMFLFYLLKLCNFVYQNFFLLYKKIHKKMYFIVIIQLLYLPFEILSLLFNLS